MTPTETFVSVPDNYWDNSNFITTSADTGTILTIGEVRPERIAIIEQTSSCITLRSGSTHNSNYIDHIVSMYPTMESVIRSEYQTYASTSASGFASNTINENFTVGTNIYTWTGNTLYVYPSSPDKKEVAKSVMKSNLLIKVKNRHSFLSTGISAEEEKARNMLRDMITEQEWRRYITNSFIMVKGASGNWYQIFNNRGVNVYKDGKRTHYICIHTDSSCPPSDHVVNMKVLIELDERIIWKCGNARTTSNNTDQIQIDMPARNLLQAYLAAAA